MNIFRFSIIRALVAVVAGVLLLKYQGAMLKGLTIGLGILFLIAGVAAIASWLNLRRQKVVQKTTLEGTILPIVGVGSFILGLVLSLMLTSEFDIWSLYIVGSSLIVGCLNQMMNLSAARKYGPLSGLFWILPLLICVTSVVAMLKGLVPPEVPTKILGIAALTYAAADLIYSLILNSMRTTYERTEAQLRRTMEQADGSNLPEVTGVSD